MLTVFQGGAAANAVQIQQPHTQVQMPPQHSIWHPPNMNMRQGGANAFGLPAQQWQAPPQNPQQWVQQQQQGYFQAPGGRGRGRGRGNASVPYQQGTYMAIPDQQGAFPAYLQRNQHTSLFQANYNWAAPFIMHRKEKYGDSP